MQTSATGKRRARNSSGFTVFELILVMVILVIAGAAALPALPAYTRGTSLRTAATRLGSLARYAGGWAVAHNRTVSLAYDGDRRSFTLSVAEEDAETVLAAPVMEGVEQTQTDTEADEIDAAWRTLRLPPDVTLESGETASGDRLDGAGVVRFFPDGRTDEATLVLGTSEQRRTVRIEGRRGRVTVEVGDGEETHGAAAAQP